MFKLVKRLVLKILDISDDLNDILDELDSILVPMIGACVEHNPL